MVSIVCKLEFVIAAWISMFIRGSVVMSDLTNDDYQRAAANLDVEVAAIKAVVQIEAAGRGFLADGRPKILFERHWFWKLTPKPVSKIRPDLSNGTSSEPAWIHISCDPRLKRQVLKTVPRGGYAPAHL